MAGERVFARIARQVPHHRTRVAVRCLSCPWSLSWMCLKERNTHKQRERGVVLHALSQVKGLRRHPFQRMQLECRNATTSTFSTTSIPCIHCLCRDPHHDHTGAAAAAPILAFSFIRHRLYFLLGPYHKNQSCDITRCNHPCNATHHQNNTASPETGHTPVQRRCSKHLRSAPAHYHSNRLSDSFTPGSELHPSPQAFYQVHAQTPTC